jgi:hypothetical protein
MPDFEFAGDMASAEEELARLLQLLLTDVPILDLLLRRRVARVCGECAA